MTIIHSYTGGRWEFDDNGRLRHRPGPFAERIPLRLSALGDRIGGFLGDRLILPRVVEVEDVTHRRWIDSLRLPDPLDVATLQDRHIIIDGYRYSIDLDSRGTYFTWEIRERGDRTFRRLTATVTGPVE